jgi:hypothetical protein
MFPVRIILSLGMLVSQSCLADYFQAAIDKATWAFSGGQGICTLTQELPLYGLAEFVSKPGQPLRFSIQEQRRKPIVVKASLAVMPAPWRRETLSGKNYPVYLESPQSFTDFGRLSVYSEAAEAMLDVLLQGQYPTFSYIRAASSLDTEETRVAVSAIKFAEKYKEFLSCRNTGTVAATTNSNLVNPGRKKRRG